MDLTSRERQRIGVYKPLQRCATRTHLGFAPGFFQTDAAGSHICSEPPVCWQRFACRRSSRTLYVLCDIPKGFVCGYSRRVRAVGRLRQLTLHFNVPFWMYITSRRNKEYHLFCILFI
ncbi:hypothetical protein CHARACLAT_033047 [Characodon lateralis]|uniref:Uncharacterized protein n=1 Tax=Characodon lateralis TaxID=208331 RepID=A0ABU7F8E2_9TELE|nr:hypothetical protein [Characodon lateralis]